MLCVADGGCFFVVVDDGRLTMQYGFVLGA